MIELIIVFVLIFLISVDLGMCILSGAIKVIGYVLSFGLSAFLLYCGITLII